MRHSDDFASALIKNLVNQGTLTEKQGKDVLTAFEQRVSKESFEYFLFSEGFVPKEDLLQALASYYKVPAFDAQGTFFEHKYVQMFPKDTMLRNNFIPLDVEDEIMTIVASDPSNSELPEIINSFVSYSLVFLVGFEDDIDDAVKEYYDDALTVDPEIINDAESEDEEAEHMALDDVEDVYDPFNDYDE